MKARKSKTKVTAIFAKRLNELVKARMEQENINKTQIAKDIGIERPSLTKYLSDDTEIGINALVKIAKYLNVSTDYLLGLTDTPSIDPSERIACEATGLTSAAIKNCKYASKKYTNSPVRWYRGEKRPCGCRYENNTICQVIEAPEFIEVIEFIFEYMRFAFAKEMRKKTNYELAACDKTYPLDLGVEEYSRNCDVALYRASRQLETIAANIAERYKKTHHEKMNALAKDTAEYIMAEREARYS